MLSAAPPRASPSSFVRITPVSPRRLWNSPAERTASWPIMESAMKRISLGCSSFFSILSSFINSSSMCRRPAVSTRITSLAESFASLIAPLTISRLRKPFGEFSRRRGLAGALQAHNHPHRRRARSKQRLGVFAKHRREFIANHFDHLLVGRKLQQHFAADCFRADVGKQLVGHADVDIAFEQRLADFGKRGVQMLVGELALPAQVLKRPLQLLCQILKHSSLQATRD